MRIFPAVPPGLIVALLIGGLIMLPLAALFVALGLRQRSRIRGSQGWPSTPGKVVSSKMVQGSSSEGGTSQGAEVVYSYLVAGQEYRTDQRSFGGGGSGSLVGEERLLARYPAGSAVTVYYNPANPQDAVLERTSGTVSLMFGLCAMFVLFAWGFGGCALLFAANNYYLASR